MKDKLGNELTTDGLLEVIKVLRQAVMEVRHAQHNGSGWYTKGSNGLYQQVRMHLDRASEALDPINSILDGQCDRPEDAIPATGSKADPSLHCNICGQHVQVLAQNGRYLDRINEKGVPFIGVCSPSCEHDGGNKDTALLDALESVED